MTPVRYPANVITKFYVHFQSSNFGESNEIATTVTEYRH